MDTPTQELIVPQARIERTPSYQPIAAGNDAATVMTIIERMMREPIFDPARIREMLQLKKLYEDGEAEKAFNEAMAAFKKNPPQVHADKVNKQYDSAYSSLGNFVNTVNAALGEYGLEASWEIEQSDKIKVTCVLAHKQGHKRRVAISGPPDVSGSKNPIQQIKSTLTYLELATYQAVTGIAVQGASADDDGKGAAPTIDTIDEKQIADINALITEVNANRDAFMRYYKIRELADIKKASYSAIIKTLEGKRKAS